MLEVQKYLKEHSLEKLNSKYGIKYKLNDDGRVLLDYCQIESDKYKSHDIVRECRGLVLENNTWNLVARSFPRFFNYPDVDSIDWANPVNVTVKEDGTLINVHYYNGAWHATTRYSWGDLQVNDSDFTWRDLVFKHLDLSKLDDRFNFIFELVGPYNKVVVDYPEGLVLLSVFMEEYEADYNDVKDVAEYIGVPHVKSFDVSSEEELFGLLGTLNKGNVTCEGFVLRDINNVRSKVKHLDYYAAHRLANNGNVASPKILVPRIMEKETDELLSFDCFKHVRPVIEQYKQIIDDAWKEIDNCWYCYHDVENKKAYAELIIKSTKYTYPLFQAKKYNSHPKEFFTVDYVLKNLFNK